MRLAEVKKSLRHRLKHPATWVLVLGFFALMMAGALLSSTQHGSLTASLGVGGLLGLMLLSAMGSAAPWQWSGDERSLAPWYRGLFQAALYALCFSVVASMVATFFSKKPSLQGFAIKSLGFGLTLFVTSAPVGIILAKWDALRRESESDKEKARQMKWMSQRGSFSPKLLFENLAHLSQSAAQDPKAAEKGLENLAGLYREWLVEASKPLINVGTELHMLEQYVALEKKRWGDPLKITERFDLQMAPCAIPPLLFLSFIEQALTQNPAQSCQMIYEISGTAAWVSLRFTIIGDLPQPSPEALQNAQGRILTAFEQMGQIQITPDAKGWTLEMKIPKRNLEL